MLGKFAYFLSSADSFQNQLFQNTIQVSNILDQDQARFLVGPDLGLNCLQKLSANETCR